MRSAIRPEHWVASLRVRLKSSSQTVGGVTALAGGKDVLVKGIWYTIIKIQLQENGEVLVALDLPNKEVGGEMLFCSSTLFVAECDPEEEEVSKIRQVIDWFRARFKRTAGA